jgi:hypothetical protein
MNIYQNCSSNCDVNAHVCVHVFLHRKTKNNEYQFLVGAASTGGVYLRLFNGFACGKLF